MKELLENWQQVLQFFPGDLEQSAKQCGAFQRARGVPDAQTLLRLLMVYCTTPLSFRQTVAWAKGLGLAQLSDVSLIERMERCEGWLRHLLAQCFEASLPKTRGERSVHLVDATTVVSPDGQVWRLHVVYEAQRQEIQQLILGDAQVGEHFRNFKGQSNVLYLADRGYHHAKGIDGLLEEHAQVLCRLKSRGYLRYADPQRIVEIPVPRGRVIIAPLPAEKQAQVAKRLERQASRRQRKLGPKASEASAFLFLFCSDPSLCAGEAVALYRWRWQVELLFKRLKSLQGIDEMTLKSPPLIRVYLLCHALVALLAQRIRQTLEASFPPEAVEAAVSLAALAIPLPLSPAGMAHLPAQSSTGQTQSLGQHRPAQETA